MDSSRQKTNAQQGGPQGSYFVRLVAKRYTCLKCGKLLFTGRVVYAECKCTRCGEMNLLSD